MPLCRRRTRRLSDCSLSGRGFTQSAHTWACLDSLSCSPSPFSKRVYISGRPSEAALRRFTQTVTSANAPIGARQNDDRTWRVRQGDPGRYGTAGGMCANRPSEAQGHNPIRGPHRTWQGDRKLNPASKTRPRVRPSCAFNRSTPDGSSCGQEKAASGPRSAARRQRYRSEVRGHILLLAQVCQRESIVGPRSRTCLQRITSPFGQVPQGRGSPKALAERLDRVSCD